MANKNRYIEVYNKAEEYLQKITPSGIDLEKYYVGDDKDYKTLDDVFLRFIYSAQNYQSIWRIFDEKRKDCLQL